MDLRVFLCTLALSLCCASSSALWIYLEPRFDADFINRNWDMLGYQQESSSAAYDTQYPPTVPRMEVMSQQVQQPIPTNYQEVMQPQAGVPIRKRNHEILNTLIGLPTKLKQRG
ncbi:hypothetical protein RvY_18662 [Ramazzottius varieornatus]|uniref:Uncharacterized protein n=1 Tax=Ramazzottius varieornatus TaxID=947166 RepID=A0A1D1WAT9_RAMVA|nr:hypothetical protein RvY_18662 [Ramazzottius varieornatus]